MYEFVRVVLAGTEEVWAAEFARHGRTYTPPTLVVYRKMVRTGCGGGSSAMGPFYCPADQRIYIDLSFYDELAETFQAPGDFAQAYVLAHEVGHHVQNLLGTSGKVSAMRGRPDYNQYSVRLELQADYYAGVWAHHSREYLEKGDVEEAMRAAHAIGDDAIQKKAQGRVVPHAFTHGTSDQRMRWFMKGLENGRMEEGDTFSGRYESLTGAATVQLERADATLIRAGLRDVLVEPRRAALIPGFDRVKAAAMDGGALGASISGAGPAVFAWFDSRTAAELAAPAMRSGFIDAGFDATAWVSPVAATGARLLSPDSQSPRP